LETAGGGFGALALAWMTAQENAAAAEPEKKQPGLFAPKAPHFKARAKSVIFLFMDGGPSHIDLFDPKPKLNELAGQTLPESFGRVDTANGVGRNKLLATKFRFKKYGESAIPVSTLLPNIAECVDDLCILRSCHAEGKNHAAAVCQMNTGTIIPGRPSLGAWTTYGLGTFNQSLPAFVVLADDPKPPPGGPVNWGSGFLPPVYQGTKCQQGPNPFPNLKPPAEFAYGPQQSRKMDFLNELNRRHLAERKEDGELAARISGYELAFRMQAEAPDVVDLMQEEKATRDLYGLHQKKTTKVARNCLLARRLVERGVRFVQVYCGAGCQWDAHEDLEANHTDRCRESDQPIAALLQDLKRTGLLKDTLVIWGGEFGRTPMSELGKGRDHNPGGFTKFLAGGGVKCGQIIGATDELGLRAVKDPVSVHDVHATVLAAMGLDHRQVTFNRNGRDERPTVDAGEVIEKVFA
jgi:hypothetical protein